ncbi:unannotated protein [freshwater metagenome]|uniref:Unannotated protein n=1 Tax=freshwater metagenome TaxID=449393 RepID=A0A6J7T0K6_9ZZZZ
MSRLARRRSSISKHSGALMSSRLMPPNVGAMRCTKSTTSSAVRALMQIGKPLTPPNSLNKSALPSITGIAPSGPMSPRPRTAVPLLTIATVFLRIVYLCDNDGSFSIAVHTRATPGVYAIDKSSRSFTGAVVMTSILPASCMRNVRSHQSRTVTPSSFCTAPTTVF